MIQPSAPVLFAPNRECASSVSRGLRELLALCNVQVLAGTEPLSQLPPRSLSRLFYIFHICLAAAAFDAARCESKLH